MIESPVVLDIAAVRQALAVRDLTDPMQGPHAMQCLLTDTEAAVRRAWACEVRVERRSPIVSIADNYDRLHYPADGAARAARYTRYVCDSALLRTQTSAMIPPLLRQLAQAPVDDLVLMCPGLVYRRDSIDRLHTSEPHQMDVWRIARNLQLGVGDLQAWIALLMSTLLPGREYRCVAAEHPYTEHGLQIDVREGDTWIEVGECGLASPALLVENGLAAPSYSGLALGLGLDRLVMLRKQLDDVRLLRASDPRIAGQMLDLSVYRPVSSMPAVRRDLSVVVAQDTGEEALGDAVRCALGERAQVIESVQVVNETSYAALPTAAQERLGIRVDQKNALLRISLRALDRTLTHHECNVLRDEIYAAVHCGSRWEWAARHANS
jgi:phenylalanyl-tRNA synthetase alpha chain